MGQLALADCSIAATSFNAFATFLANHRHYNQFRAVSEAFQNLTVEKIPRQTFLTARDASPLKQATTASCCEMQHCSIDSFMMHIKR